MRIQSKDREEIKNFISTSRSEGKSDQEIYDALVPKYENKQAIALLITGTVTPYNKSKYQSYNNFLLGLIVLVVILRVIMGFAIAKEIQFPYSILIILAMPLIPILFAVAISKYQAAAYRLLGFLTIIGILREAQHFDSSIFTFFSILLYASIIGLSFFLYSKMFPNFGVKKLEKDLNGDYILPPQENVSDYPDLY